MTNFIRPILGVFTIAGASVILTGCDEHEQAAGDRFLSAFGVSTSVPAQSLPVAFVEVQGVGMEEVLHQIEGSGPMGEDLWTGPGCSPVWRIRMCV